MAPMMSILASSNPIEHIMDVPWRIGGTEIPWMSSQISVMILATILLLIGMPLLTWRGQRRSDRVGLGLVEVAVTFVRVQIAQMALGKNADRAVPYLTTLFIFLLTVNILGLVPLAEVSGAIGLYGWGGAGPNGEPMNVTPIGGTPTSGLWVGIAFAAMTLLLVMLSGYVNQVYALWRGTPPEHAEQAGEAEHHEPIDPGMNIWLEWSQRISDHKYPLPLAMVGGVWTWLNSFVPPVPGTVGLILWPVLLVLEMVGYVTKCFALCIRLVANMTSGHILLVVVLGFAQGSRGWMNLLVGIPAGFGVIALLVLELVVALLQAYIFTFLSALFVGLAINPHH